MHCLLDHVEILHIDWIICDLYKIKLRELRQCVINTLFYRSVM